MSSIVKAKRGQTVRRRWTGTMVWDGRSLGQTDDWTYYLNENDLADIRAAVETGKSSTKLIGDLTSQDFEFGKFTQRLRILRKDILEGRGFAILRGLSDDQWSDVDLIYAYWGIGTWLGDPVSQNARADLLGHIIDQRLSPSAETRVYQTNQALTFHSDSCDIAGLLCLRKARNGGASSMASSSAIHNALLDNDPDALDTLYGEYQCDRYGEIPEGKLPYYTAHVFNEVDGKFVCCGMDPDIRSAQRLDDVDPLSRDQIRALDVFQKTARMTSLNMSLERGDIQLVNNLTVVHAREEFEDYVELDKRRYLIRLWLSSPLGRRLPEFMVERWGNIDVGTVRGGIKVPGAIPAVYLDPDH